MINSIDSITEKQEKQKSKKFASYKTGAAQRSHPFYLTYEQFIQICEQNCHYCGAEPLGGGDNVWPHNGIDRKNNKKGYELENCLPCCSWCNRAKGQRSYYDFKKHLDQVVTNGLKNEQLARSTASNAVS